MIKCREVYKHTDRTKTCQLPAMCINSQVFMSECFRSWRTVALRLEVVRHFKHQIIETVNVTNIHSTIKKRNSSVSCEDV